MNSAEAPALASALALRRSPLGARPRPDERLPEGVLLLVRIAAGDEQALAQAQNASLETADTLREAATFYLQQVLFANDASSYRMLGVDTDAPDEQIREHYRWLARWLHPDRNANEWEVIYADRVSQAWQNLRTAERRSRYDEAQWEALPAQDAAWNAVVEPTSAASPARPPALHSYDAPDDAAAIVNLRWLPKAILGGLGLTAVVVVVLFSVVQLSEEQAGSAASVAALPPAEALSEPMPASSQSDSSAALGVGDGAEPVDDFVEAGPVPVAAPTEPATQPVEPPASVAAASAAPAIATVPRPLPPASRSESSAAAPALHPAEARVPKPAAATAPEIASTQVAPATPRPTRAERRAAAKAAAAERAAAAVSAAAVEPAAVQSPAAVAEAPALTISQRDANRLLNQFSAAYESGSLDEMRALFTDDVQGSRGGMRDILKEYDTLFGSSSKRSLSVRDVNWFVDGERLTIVASYRAIVTSSRGGRQREIRGDLRLDLRRGSDGWRIFRLRHDEQPG
jgi:hypothetical protein